MMKKFDLTFEKIKYSVPEKYKTKYLKDALRTKTFSCEARDMEEAIEKAIWAFGMVNTTVSDHLELEGIDPDMISRCRRAVNQVEWALSNDKKLKKMVADAGFSWSYKHGGFLKNDDPASREEYLDFVLDNYSEISDIASERKSTESPTDASGQLTKKAIVSFFDALNSAIGYKIDKIVPLISDNWKGDIQSVKKRFAARTGATVSFNAMLCVSAGSVYSGKDSPEDIKERVPRIEKRINDVLKKMDLDQKYLGRKIVATVVNKKFEIVMTRADYSDDGDDTFGCWLAISFKEMK